MQKIILALAGEMGCGKGAIAEYLTTHHDAQKFRFSTLMRDILDRMHIEKTRENVQNMSSMLRNAFWDNILSQVLAGDITQSDKSLIVVDGVRRPGELDYIRPLGTLIFIYVHVDPEIRYARIIGRGENVAEHLKTFSDFQKDGEHESEDRTRALRDIADHVIENNGTIEELQNKIEKVLKWL